MQLGSREGAHVNGQRRYGAGAGALPESGAPHIAPVAACLAVVNGRAVVHRLPPAAGGVPAAGKSNKDLDILKPLFQHFSRASAMHGAFKE
jgi:hypothetical protein